MKMLKYIFYGMPFLFFLAFALVYLDDKTYVESQITFGSMRNLTLMLGLDPKEKWKPSTLDDLVKVAQSKGVNILYHRNATNPFPGVLRNHVYSVNFQGAKPNDVLIAVKFSFWLREDYIALVYWNGEWECGSLKAIAEYKKRRDKMNPRANQ